jgi:Ca2+:H+ antiporter
MMISRNILGIPLWGVATPLATAGVLMAAWGQPLAPALLAFVIVALIAAVFVAVHHAEIIALRVGEPFGTLVLALAVTVIEVALIVSLMMSGGSSTATLARDTVFATVMIVCNGVVGFCLLVGGIRHRVSEFRVDGTSQALSVLIPLSALTLILPNFTTTTPGPTYSAAQLQFVAAMSLVLYGLFVFVQTVRHRDYFLPLGTTTQEAHVQPPSAAGALASLGLLLVCLVSVVGLAKTLAPGIEAAVVAAAAPLAVVGVAIALLVLLPETVAATRAAASGRMQTSLNLALGSALATIGLTVPSVAALSVLFDLPLVLGLPPAGATLLAVTLLGAVVTLATGRSTVLHGAVHLALFCAYLFLALVP